MRCVCGGHRWRRNLENSFCQQYFAVKFHFECKKQYINSFYILALKILNISRDKISYTKIQKRTYIHIYVYIYIFFFNGIALFIVFNQRNMPHVSGRETRYLQALIWVSGSSRPNRREGLGLETGVWGRGVCLSSPGTRSLLEMAITAT